MKTEKADAAQLWLRMDGPSTTLVFDNMQNRRIKGTTDWTRYEIVLDVPRKTRYIGFGALVAGAGQAWVDDFVFEPVGRMYGPQPWPWSLDQFPPIQFQNFFVNHAT
jgi:hypothetical protein